MKAYRWHLDKNILDVVYGAVALVCGMGVIVLCLIVLFTLVNVWYKLFPQ